jgi:hypothetical protein
MSTKASTAALRHICQRLLLHRQRAACHPAGGQKKYCLPCIRNCIAPEIYDNLNRGCVCKRNPLFAAVISSHLYSRADHQPASNVLLQKQAEPAPPFCRSESRDMLSFSLWR